MPTVTTSRARATRSPTSAAATRRRRPACRSRDFQSTGGRCRPAEIPTRLALGQARDDQGPARRTVPPTPRATSRGHAGTSTTPAPPRQAIAVRSARSVPVASTTPRPAEPRPGPPRAPPAPPPAEAGEGAERHVQPGGDSRGPGRRPAAARAARRSRDTGEHHHDGAREEQPGGHPSGGGCGDPAARRRGRALPGEHCDHDASRPSRTSEGGQPQGARRGATRHGVPVSRSAQGGTAHRR